MRTLFFVALTAALAGCGQAASTAHLVAQLKSADASARLQAIDALTKTRGEDDIVIPGLMGALRDKDVFVQRAAIRALASRGTEAREALPTLRTLAKTRQRQVRQAATHALAQITP